MAGRTHTVRKRQQAASLAISSLLLTDSIRRNAVGRSLKDEERETEREKSVDFRKTGEERKGRRDR